MKVESSAAAGLGPGWILPGEPRPVRFMNTIWADRAGLHDSLSSPADLALWLVAVGATAGPVRVLRDDFASARRLRDSLRRVAALCTNDTRQAAASPIGDAGVAIAEINAAVAASPPIVRLGLRRGKPYRDTGPVTPAVTAALSALATEAIDLFAGERRSELRACLAPGCVLYFVKDHPRREWCSIACGNRARAARHYRRHRLGAQVDPDEVT